MMFKIDVFTKLHAETFREELARVVFAFTERQESKARFYLNPGYGDGFAVNRGIEDEYTREWIGHFETWIEALDKSRGQDGKIPDAKVTEILGVVKTYFVAPQFQSRGSGSSGVAHRAVEEIRAETRFTMLEVLVRDLGLIVEVQAL